jgi:hypothetical protein
VVENVGHIYFMTKKPFTFRLDATLVEKVRKAGAKDGRKLTNMIEHILSTFVKKEEKK